MSKRPPEDDSFIDKILKEFDASIDDVDVESKMAMKDALRESIQMWFPHIGMEPDIEVFDGEKQSVVDEELSDEIAEQKMRSDLSCKYWMMMKIYSMKRILFRMYRFVFFLHKI